MTNKIGKCTYCKKNLVNNDLIHQIVPAGYVIGMPWYDEI